MTSDSEVRMHYSRGDLLDRLNAALMEDGIDPARPTMEALAPYDQFHTRGLEATVQMAELVEARPDDRVLDIGCGIGGPARYFAQRFGCGVTGVDLTPEFCEVGRHLTRLLDLEDKVAFVLGDAVAMPFRDAIFSGAYSMNVSMNIADKGAFYREIHRVLKPGAWLMLSEVAQGGGGGVDYPTPWAYSERTSFLSTPEKTQSALEDAGFEVAHMHSTLDEARAFGARSRAVVERGEKPPHRAAMLVHGDVARQIMANISRAVSEGRVNPIEVLARKPGRDDVPRPGSSLQHVFDGSRTG